jgi:hypothetical protein
MNIFMAVVRFSLARATYNSSNSSNFLILS